MPAHGGSPSRPQTQPVRADDAPPSAGVQRMLDAADRQRRSRTPRRRNLDGLSLSELADELGALHGGPADQGEDD